MCLTFFLMLVTIPIYESQQIFEYEKKQRINLKLFVYVCVCVGMAG